MRIGQLAARAGTTTKTLRFYEQTGLLPEASRMPSGYRDYDRSLLERLAFIKAAQAAGLTLAEIRDVIVARELTGPPCQHVAALLDAHLLDLDERLEHLRTLRAEVQRLRDRATRLNPDDCGAAAVCQVIPTS